MICTKSVLVLKDAKIGQNVVIANKDVSKKETFFPFSVMLLTFYN